MPKDSKGGRLFDPGKSWEDEWQDMPEFIHEDLTPWKQIIVSFASREDVDAFAKLIGRKLTIDTRSIWFPDVEIIDRLRTAGITIDVDDDGGEETDIEETEAE